MRVRMMADNILVSPHSAQSETAGGIIIPESAKKKTHIGTVVATGESIFSMAEGDVIFYKPFAGPEVTIDGERYLVMDIDRVLLVAEDYGQ